MERFYRENNGRPIYNNDFALLQNELLEAAKASYKNRGAFIHNGCTVSGSGPYNISAGVVFIDNEPMRFQGATGITFPYYIYQNAVELTNYDEYNDNVSRPTRQLIQATGGTSVPGSGEYITMTTAGGRPQADAFANEYVRTVGSQTVAGNKIFSGNNTHSGNDTFTGSTTFTNNTALNGTVTSPITSLGAIQGTRLTATVATGTAPLTVSSTTAVGNLNADLLDGYHASYFEGRDNNLQSNIDALTANVNSRNYVPAGTIVLWSSSVGSIPAGWYLCNGGNGTPNLVDRFIVAAGSSYGVGATGGSNSVTLDISQMPYHNHSMTSAGSHQHYVKEVAVGEEGNDGTDQSVGNYTDSGTTKYTSFAGDHSHSINYTGGGLSHENRPLYYALCYIMKG